VTRAARKKQCCAKQAWRHTIAAIVGAMLGGKVFVVEQLPTMPGQKAVEAVGPHEIQILLVGGKEILLVRPLPEHTNRSLCPMYPSYLDFKTPFSQESSAKRELFARLLGVMKWKRYTEPQTVFTFQQAEAGTPVAEMCRKLGVAEAIFYRWKKRYDGLDVTEIRRLQQLED